MRENYFWWTANLGVVPLLRFVAFLFAPILRCLALRRASVTAVRDAMTCSFNQKISLMVIISCFCVVKDLRAAHTEDLVMAKGEQREIPLKELKNYSVGNKEVLTTKIQTGKLLLKARQTGFSDLVIWEKNQKSHYAVYVLSKSAFLKTVQLTESLKNLDLTLDLKGPLMVVKGVIKNLEDWRYLHRLRLQHKDRVVFQVEAEQSLRRLIAKNIYTNVFKAGLSKVSCRFIYLEIECTVEQKIEAYKTLFESLSQNWGAHFVSKPSLLSRTNLRLKLKLIQIEETSGQEINFGLSQLRAQPLDLFEHGLQRLIADNQIALAENHLQMSTLAEPEALVRIGKPHEIEVGAQIPFQNIRPTQGAVLAPIDWRFAGLKIITKLEEVDGQLTLDYETEFSRPQGEGISGSKEKSSLIVLPNTAYRLFQIGYKSDSLERANLPGLKDIPVLRILFGSRGKQSTYKRIEGYLILEEDL